ncbi:MAG: hypothetical protein LBT04_05930 [Prevotellaceae bacterium]|jgi:hypothetical protein|nr:hypothetical protein [Prevotellaceae bacterium]
MKLFKKIKSELDQNIAQDKLKGDSEKINDNFSVKDLIDGKILVSKGFRKFLPLICFVWLLAFFYIYNRFEYDALDRQNKKLKEQQNILETDEILKLKESKMISLRSEVIKKLAENNSTLTEAKTSPIVIK